MHTRRRTKQTNGQPAQASVAEVQQLLDATKNLEHAQKHFRLAGATTDIKIRRQTVRSTGLLMSDLMLNGGIYPAAWYTFSGQEQSAKSTFQMSVAASIAAADIPIILHFDAENSMTPDYFESIAKNIVGESVDLDNLLGIRNPDTDEWTIEPRMRYYPENGMERIWRATNSVLVNLPDKVYTDGKWWLLFNRTKTNISKFSQSGAYKGNVNKKLGDRYNVIAVEAMDNGTPQALFLIDSFPAMVTESQSSEDGDNSVAVGARGHAKLVNLVKGQLRRKHSIVIGTNQIREAISFTGYGPKEYEPGGSTLKHASDVRVSQRGRSVPHGESRYFEEESSVTVKGGIDTYRYIAMRTIKNKLGSMNIEAWFRIWTSDATGEAMGFCPVYDTWEYLKVTNQVDGTIGRKFKINEAIVGPGIKPMVWLDLKKIILLKGKALKDHCQELGFKGNPNIRAKCFKQITAGKGKEMFYDSLAASKNKAAG